MNDYKYISATCVPVALEELDVPCMFNLNDRCGGRIDCAFYLTDNVVAVALEKREHKSEWFLKINPNGKAKETPTVDIAFF